MPKLHWEDFIAGQVAEYGPQTVTAEDIKAFAAEFDPQPMHLDEEAARHSLVGGLCASGWHTCAIMMRIVADGFILDSSSMGATGCEEIKWLAPVRPGDRLRVRMEVLATRASASRPDMGFVNARLDMLNADGVRVMTLTPHLMFGRRPPMRFFEDMRVGERTELGRHTFSADEIKAFARRFDPQRFHVDEEAAARSHFGALCASGWHTTAMFMRFFVAAEREEADKLRARGETPAKAGPSPGIRDLRWLKPVYAGDTINFAREVTELRETTRRPGWGLMVARNTGTNQHGELVLSFMGAKFAERRKQKA
jgi:acyl dehydratase